MAGQISEKKNFLNFVRQQFENLRNAFRNLTIWSELGVQKNSDFSVGGIEPWLAEHKYAFFVQVRPHFKKCMQNDVTMNYVA